MEPAQGDLNLLVHERVEVGDGPLAGGGLRVLHHPADDPRRVLPVLVDQRRIPGEVGKGLFDLRERLADRPLGRLRQRLADLADEVAVEGREVGHEVERVLDLVRDAGGELAECRQLLVADELVLGRAEVGERPLQLVRPLLELGAQPLRALERLVLPVPRGVEVGREGHDDDDREDEEGEPVVVEVRRQPLDPERERDHVDPEHRGR